MAISWDGATLCLCGPERGWEWLYLPHTYCTILHTVGRMGALLHLNLSCHSICRKISRDNISVSFFHRAQGVLVLFIASLISNMVKYVYNNLPCIVTLNASVPPGNFKLQSDCLVGLNFNWLYIYMDVDVRKLNYISGRYRYTYSRC